MCRTWQTHKAVLRNSKGGGWFFGKRFPFITTYNYSHRSHLVESYARKRCVIQKEILEIKWLAPNEMNSIIFSELRPPEYKCTVEKLVIPLRNCIYQFSKRNSPFLILCSSTEKHIMLEMCGSSCIETVNIRLE